MTDQEPTTTDGVPSVTPEDLHRRLRTGERVSVLDVRDRDEFEAWRVSGDGVLATQVPHVKFLQAQVRGDPADLVADLDEPVVVVCGRGEASAQVADALRDAGVDAANLDGGMEAWARLYERVELDVGADARVFQYQRPSSGCLAYLVVSDGEAAVVDPLRAFVDRYAADAAELDAEMRYALDTHVHADHVSGVGDLAARVERDGNDAPEIVVPQGSYDRGLDYDREVRTVADGDEVRVGETTLSALHAPGHTPEMTAYLLDGDTDDANDADGDSDGSREQSDAPLLIGGDLLFLESVARPDLAVDESGAAEAAERLHQTLRKRVLSLPDATRVAPGHYSDAAEPGASGAYVATLGELRERLAALSMDEAAFVDYALGDRPPRPANYERIVAVNLGREPVDDAEAFELELGPNHCAATSAAD